MKKFVFGFLPMLFVLLGAVPAHALTLQWDKPGAITVRTSLYDTSTGIAIDPTVTQVEFTEAQSYYICPAEGYKLISCEVVDGGTSKFNISNNSTYGQFVSVSQGNSDYTLKFTTEKMVAAGSITINVLNGAEKITGTLLNSTSVMSNNTPVVFQEGEQTVNLTNYDNVLYIAKANGVTLDTLRSVKVNDKVYYSGSKYNPQYNLPIKAGDKVEIQVYDPDNMPVEYTAHFTFTNGDDKAITGVYNQSAMSTKFYAQLVADNWTETYVGGSRIRLNFNEDYVFNSITANGEPLEFAEDDINVSYVINGNTEFVIDAAERVYEDVTAQVYITLPEGVNFFDAYGEDANALTLTEGEAASGVKMGKYEVPEGTKSFTLSGINAKTGTIFFSVKPGYYVNLVACANPQYAGDDANNITFLNAWDAVNGPFYMDIRKIENSANAVTAYVGAENVARIQSYNTQGDMISSSMMTPGYTELAFDPVYNDHYAVRIAGITENEDVALFAYLDGTAITADDNGILQNIKLKDGSLLKVFLGTEAPENNRVTFTVAEGLEASVVYDKIKQHTDLSQPLVSRGATLVEITPAQPCIVKVAGKEIAANANGVYSFTTSSLSTKVELSAMPVKPLEVKSTKPAEGDEVKSFNMATLTIAMNMYEIMADAEKANTITLTTPAGETIAATGCEMNGEPSEEGFPYGIFFPEQTAEGEYTLTVPAGIFYEVEWNEAAEGYVAVENGSKNDELVLHFTVNPNALSAFEKYVLTPAGGSAVRSISTIKVTFPDVEGLYPADVDPMPEITLTNGTTTYTGNATSDWSSWPMKSFNISFMDADNEPVKITETGEWTLTVGAGLYTDMNGTEATCEVTGTFTVAPNAPISWTADPANGSKQDMPYEDYTMVTLTFDADAVSYTAKDELAGIRVMYRGEEINRLENITTDGANGYMLYDNDGEPQVIFAFNSSVFSAPGVLTIEADEGAFTVNDEASPAIKYSVTIGDVKEYTYEFTPASGSEVENLKEFTLEFPEASSASYNEDNSYIILRSSNWIYPSSPVVTAVEGAETPTFKLTFEGIEDMNLTAGSYSLRIGEGSFLLDNNQQSPEIAASWTLKRTTPVDLTWTADPTRDIINEGFGMYPTFVFNEGESLSKNRDTEAKIIVKFNDEVLSEGYGSDSEMAYSTGIEYTLPNAIMFNISGGILNNPETEGKLTIIIEEGALLVSGVPCPRMEHSWNLVKQKEYEVKVTPAEGSTVKELKEFTVEFVGAKTVEENFATGIAVRSKDYKYNGVVENIEYDNSGENAAVKITLKEALANDGEYMLQIYPSAFFLDGCQSSPEVKVNYMVDHTVGVEGIEAANGKYTVTNMAGIVVLRDANAAALGKLPAGLYIVNGKKVLLNK